MTTMRTSRPSRSAEDQDRPRRHGHHESWQRDLWNDRETLRELLEEMRRSPPTAKRQASTAHPRNAVKAIPQLGGQPQGLIFSAFADTANYLYKQLAAPFSDSRSETALVTGGAHAPKTTLGTGFDFQQVLTCSRRGQATRHLTMPQATGGLDVLIGGTDVISEGQNLQDCDYLVNYDIIGTRSGSSSASGRVRPHRLDQRPDQLVNFWPDISLDEYINPQGSGSRTAWSSPTSRHRHDNILTLKAAMPRVPKNWLRRSGRVIELEDVRTGVHHADLGPQRLPHGPAGIPQRKSLSRTAAPKGLHAVLTADPSKVTRCVVRAAQRRRRREHQSGQPASPALPCSTSTATAT